MQGNGAFERQQALIRAIVAGGGLHPGAGAVSLIETHISHVLLSGGFAYKIKKPLNLGFLDFSTLDKRRFYCEEELRLNRRLAPDLYLDVVAIHVGADGSPRLGEGGEAVEYAVRMREFPQAGLFDRLARSGALNAARIDRVAERVAEFHRHIARATAADPYGDAAAVRQPVDENFRQIEPLLANDAERRRLRPMREWSEAACDRLRGFFDARKRDGFVRECHGDLHLGNIFEYGGDVGIFDGIEFNPGLRWIDVVNEIAFLAMDLEVRGYSGLAWRFINRYLEAGGDYDGLVGLQFYRVYRAVVRAKIALIRAAQADASAAERRQALEDYAEHLAYVERTVRPSPTALLITHGFSGAGKTHASQALVEVLGAVRLRSDVERKRLHGLAAAERSGSAVDAGIYTPAATDAVYAELLRLARRVIASGLPAVVDAAFLDRRHRAAFRDLAAELRIPFLIVDCTAPEAVLRSRLAGRRGDASEATAAVLEKQMRSADPLAPDEVAASVAVDGLARDPDPAIAETAHRLGWGD